MSRTQSVESLAFADRLERTEGLVAKIQALEEKIAALEAEKTAEKPPETFADRLRDMNARDAEYLAQFEERVKAERAAAATAQKERRDEEARRLAAEPKSPSLDQIRTFVKSVERLLAFAGVEKYTYLQEESVLPYVEVAIDTLLTIEAAPLTGWPMTVRRALHALVQAFRSVLGSWGWWHMIAHQEARKTILDRLRKEWQNRTEVPAMRVAELWLRLCEEGTETWPSEKVVKMGLTARERKYQPIEILPRHRSAVMGEKDIQTKIEVPKLFDEMWAARGNLPMFGNVRPSFTEEQRNSLMGAISTLWESLPQEKRAWGWLIGGSTIADYRKE